MSDPLVRQDLLDLQELLVHLALQARGVSLGIGDHQDNQVLLGNQAHREMLVLKDQQGHKAQKVQLDRKVLQVWLGLLVHQAQLGSKAQKDYSEIREIRVHLVQLVIHFYARLLCSLIALFDVCNGDFLSLIC